MFQIKIANMSAANSTYKFRISLVLKDISSTDEKKITRTNELLASY